MAQSIIPVGIYHYSTTESTVYKFPDGTMIQTGTSTISDATGYKEVTLAEPFIHEYYAVSLTPIYVSSSYPVTIVSMGRRTKTSFGWYGRQAYAAAVIHPQEVFWVAIGLWKL